MCFSLLLNTKDFYKRIVSNQKFFFETIIRSWKKVVQNYCNVVKFSLKYKSLGESLKSFYFDVRYRLYVKCMLTLKYLQINLETDKPLFYSRYTWHSWHRGQRKRLPFLNDYTCFTVLTCCIPWKLSGLWKGILIRPWWAAFIGVVVEALNATNKDASFLLWIFNGIIWE